MIGFIPVELDQSEIKRLAFFSDFLKFLIYISQNKAKLTKTGNLSLKDIEALSKILAMEIKLIEKWDNGVIWHNRSETKFRDLHKINLIAQIAKYIRRYRGKVVITRYGKRYLDMPLDHQYYFFFLTFWDQLNWTYFHLGVDGAGRTIAEILQESNNDLAQVLVEWVRKNDLIDFKKFADFICHRYGLIPFKDEVQRSFRGFAVDIEHTVVDEFERIGLVVCKRKKEKVRSLPGDIQNFYLTKNGFSLLRFIVESRRIRKFYEA